MSLSQLQTAIQVNKGTFADYTWAEFVISQGFIDFLTNATRTNRIQIQFDTISGDSKRLIVSGQARWSQMHTAAVEIECLSQGTTNEMRLSLNVKTMAAVKDLLVPWQAGFLSKLTFQECSIEYYSDGFKDSGSHGSPWVELSGTAEHVEIGTKTTLLAPLPANARVTGMLRHENQFYIENYRIPFSLAEPFKEIETQNGHYEVESILISANEGTVTTDTWMAIDVKIGSQWVTVSGLVPNYSDTLSLLLIPQNPKPFSLDEIASLVPGADLGKAMPTELNDLGGLQINYFETGIALSAPSLIYLRINLSSEAIWKVIPNKLEIGNLRFTLSIIKPFDKANRHIGVDMRGVLTLAGQELIIQALFPEMILSAASGERFAVSLSKLIDDLSVGSFALDDVPDVELSEINILMAPTTGAFLLSGTGNAQWEGKSAQASLSLNRTFVPGNEPHRRKSQVDCSVSLKGQGPLEIADELTIKSFDLEFSLVQDREWAAWGTVTAILFEKEFTLAAAYGQSNGQRALRFATATASPLEMMNLPGIGSFTVSRLALEVLKQAGNGQSTSATAWNVAANAGIKVDNVFDFQGTLTLFKKAGGATGLIFNPTKAIAKIPLPIPGQNVVMNLNFSGIAIVRNVATTGSSQPAGWAFETSAGLSCTGLPGDLGKELAKVVQVDFRADNSGATLTVAKLMQAVEIPLPDITIGSTKVPLGKLVVDISTLRIALGRQIAVTADFGLGLPKELNNVFGVNASGSAQVDLFQTFNPANPSGSMVKLRMGLKDKDFTFTPLTSPLKAIQLTQEGGASWWYCNLGEFGEIKFKVPVLQFDGASQSFEASGGFTIVKPLKLPLTPIKQLLTACKLEGAAKLLPDGVPIEKVEIVDQRGNFKVNELFSFIERAGQLPREVKNVLMNVGTSLSRLPKSFTEYLNFTVPTSLFFDISVAGGGNVKFSLRTYDKKTTSRQDAKPIRLIFPGLVQGAVPLPGFNGMQLRSISFGPLTGGSLFLLQVDGIFDQFDIATLAASLALPTDKKFPLPTSNQLQRRVRLEELFMIIVYQAGVPIPIPIFYENLGLEFLGIEGVGLQTYIRLPQPKPTLSGLAMVLSNFSKFFSDRNYLLDPKKPPQGLNLRFTLGANSIQLPEYLGGILLGKNTDIATLDVYENLAHLLNGLKTLTVNELIQAIPLAHRVGAAKLSFFTLSIDCSWAITTPKEFREVAYKSLQLPEAQRESALQILPRTQPQGDPQGLVIFLKGGFNITNVVGFQSMFGLVASGPTGFLITGTVASFINVMLAGAMVINPAGGTPFSVTGKSELTIFNQTVLAGALSINEKGLFITGAVDLFPGVKAVTAKGNISGNITKDGFGLDGNIDLAAGGVTIIKGSALISHAGIAITGKFLGNSVTLAAMENQGKLRLQGGFELSVSSVAVRNIVHLSVLGALIVDPSSRTPFNVAGSSKLTVLNKTVLIGTLSGTEKGMSVSGAIDLFPGLTAVTAKGNVSGNLTKDNFLLNGSVNLDAGGVRITSGRAAISQTGIAIVGKFLAIDTTFSASEVGGSLQIKGTANVWVQIASVGPIDFKGARVADKINLNLTVSSSVNCSISSSGFSASIAASPSPKVLGQTVPISFTISTAPANVQAVATAIAKEIEKAIARDFQKFFGDAGKFLTNFVNGTIMLSGNPIAAVTQVLEKVYSASVWEIGQLLLKFGVARP